MIYFLLQSSEASEGMEKAKESKWCREYFIRERFECALPHFIAIDVHGHLPFQFT